MTVSDGCYGGNKINNAEQGSESWGNEGKVHNFQFLSGYWASLLAQQLRICLPGGGLGSIPGSGRSSGEENNSPPVFLPGKSHGQRNQVGYSPWGRKRLTELND